MSLILLLAYAACIKNKHPYEGLKLPNKTDYNQIICEILKQDTTFINKGLLKSNYIGERLIKIDIDLNITKKYPSGIPPTPNLNQFHTTIAELINYKFLDSNNLETETLYFLFQKDSSKEISINKSINNTLKFATREIILQNTLSQTLGYFQFSLPIVNSTITKAYVQADFISSNAGGGMIYILEKINDNWILTLAKSRCIP